jgi:hypothetical protein
MRRAVATACLLSLTLAAAWLASRVAHPHAVRVGSSLPSIAYRDPHGTHTLTAAPGRRTVVVLVAATCAHCDYQLEVLNRGAAQFASTRLYLLSTEHDLFESGGPARYPALTASALVAWGIVDRAEFERTFGVAMTPAVFIFDDRGRLVRSLRGETKLEALLTRHG